MNCRCWKFELLASTSLPIETIIATKVSYMRGLPMLSNRITVCLNVKQSHVVFLKEKRVRFSLRSDVMVWPLGGGSEFRMCWSKFSSQNSGINMSFIISPQFPVVYIFYPTSYVDINIVWVTTSVPFTPPSSSTSSAPRTPF